MLPLGATLLAVPGPAYCGHLSLQLAELPLGRTLGVGKFPGSSGKLPCPFVAGAVRRYPFFVEYISILVSPGATASGTGLAIWCGEELPNAFAGYEVVGRAGIIANRDTGYSHDRQCGAFSNLAGLTRNEVVNVRARAFAGEGGSRHSEKCGG